MTYQTEHKQYFNESYVESNKMNNFTWRFYLTESSIEIEGAFLWGYLDQDQ